MMKKMLAILMTLCLLLGVGCVQAQEWPAASYIVLSDEQVTVNGEPASTEPTSTVYTANDIVFYLAGQDFTYGEGEEWEGHTQAEADAHTVVHITQPGTYVLSGKMSAGQIAVDVKDGKKDPEAVVTLVLNGVDITCSVAPAVIFYDVYECGEKDEEKASMTVDTSAAGANVIIADGTVNSVNGSHVARIYEPGTVKLNEAGTEVEEADKLHKYDAAFYSKRTMNVSGGPEDTGVLNIESDNEGLDSELHLTINGGHINISSGNDGINTNEDNVSVTTINGGCLTIRVHGSTGEGDGIDSNGWLVINGGSVVSAGCGFSGDAGIDSDKGIYINGGEVCATGNMFDHIAGGDAPYMVLSFSGRVTGGSVIAMKNEAGETVAEWSPANDFSYLVVSGQAVEPGRYTLWQGDQQLGYTGTTVRAFGGGMTPPDGFGGRQMTPPEGFEMPEGMQPPEGFDPSEMTPPEGFEMPEGMQPPENFDPSEMTPPEGFEMPEGMQPPEGFDSSEMTPPDGFAWPEGERPQDGGRGFGGRRGWNVSERQSGEMQTEFIITEEGGTYSGVGPAAQ